MNNLDLSDNRDRLLPSVLQLQAAAIPQQRFLVSDHASLTFREVDEISARLAAGLSELGVTKGDRVAFFLSNRVEVVLLAFAVNKLGAIWTPINADYRGEWLRDTLSRCRARVIVTDSRQGPHLANAGEATANTALVVLDRCRIADLEATTTYETLLQYEPMDVDYSAFDYGDSCCILWTSGTTGKSKGVLQSHNNWIRAVTGCSRQFQSVAGDVIYCALPLYNTAAWITSIYRALIEGLPVVIEDKFSVSNFMSRIRQFEATQTFVIGSMGVFLWNTPAQDDDAEIPLRVAGITPMPPDILEPFQKRFGVRILPGGFGMSELQAGLTQGPGIEGVPHHAMGFPYDDIELKLCDNDGNEVAPGEPGEMWVRALAPHVLFNGYFDNPEATAAAFEGEWFRTGDIARQDPDNRAYFFVDRKKDSVRFAGRNISTMEVESVARRHPAIRDVAVYGIPSAVLASEDELKLDAVIEPGETLTPEALCQFINENAPHFFVPRFIDFVDELPYTPTNKIEKYRLRDKGVGEQTWDLKASDYTVKR